MSWKFTKAVKTIPKLKSPILIEGLPGIGNVGKISADFLIEELKAVKLYDIFSYQMPNSVFVNDKNRVELPSISVYYKKFKNNGNDLIILAGDIQPTDDVGSYEFCDQIIDMLREFKGKEIITLGGIGLPQIPEKPKVYITGNNKKIITKYAKGTKVSEKLYGIVGPIIGVSGLLVGLAERKNIKAIAMLSETYGHPMYLGMKGSREMLNVLNKKLNLKLKLSKLDKDIKDFESEIRKSKALIDVAGKKNVAGASKGETTNYIG